MSANLSEVKKTLGILGILAAVSLVTAAINPSFIQPYNLQNLIRWTALFGILSLGVSFVIITGGIDLSIGSLLAIVGCLMPKLLIEHGWSPIASILFLLFISVCIGLFHGLLITKLKLQPFVVTLCGLLLYRGLARFFTADQTQGFGTGFPELRSLATGRPISMSLFLIALGTLILLSRMVSVLSHPRESSILSGSLAVLAGPFLWLRRRGEVKPSSRGLISFVAFWTLIIGLVAHFNKSGTIHSIAVPTPFLILSVLALIASFALTKTVWGRYLFAVGRNESAARYSGIRTDRIVISAYVACSFMGGVGGILLALDVNSIQPAAHGNFYELYAIAAAVLGGCSLRGGEGSVMGVLVGAALLRVLYNSINLLEIPTQLELAIIGAVILIGVTADEVIRRWVIERKRQQELLDSNPLGNSKSA